MATQSIFQEKTKSRVKEPGQYNVIMWNDDFTPMDFVVELLETVFHKDPAGAEALMLTVHRSGRAIIAKYPYDLAATKVAAAINWARAEGYPFRVTMEEE